MRVDRDQHFPVLRICRPIGANSGRDGNDSDYATVVVSFGLYRRANYLERDQDISGIVDSSYWLMEAARLLNLQKRTTTHGPSAEFSRLPEERRSIQRRGGSLRLYE